MAEGFTKTLTRPPLSLFHGSDPHAVERPIDEGQGKEQEDRRQKAGRDEAGVLLELKGELHCQQPEERSEVEDRVDGVRRGVLEGGGGGIVEDRSGVECRGMLLTVTCRDMCD